MRSPFTGVRFARLEFSNFRAGKMIALAVCAIALIPLIYGGLFLLAFLDPYGSLSNVPAVVVNMDEGAKVNGEFKNVGQTLCDKLVENNENAKEGEASGFDWHFESDESKAKEGLEDATYYMEIIIPKNFSDNIASADSSNPKNAELQVYLNPSTNLIATTVGQSMVTKIKAELNSEIEKEYFDNIFVKISDAADSIQDAVAGSKQLADGTQTLSKGITKVGDGVETLNNSISDAMKSSAKLSDVIKGVAAALQKQDFDKAVTLAAKVKSMNSEIGTDLYKYVKKLKSSYSEYASAMADSEKKKEAMASAQSELTTKAKTMQSDLTALGGTLPSLQASLVKFQTAVAQATDLAGMQAALQAAGEMASCAKDTALAGAALVSSQTTGSGVELLLSLNSFSDKATAYQTSATTYAQAAAAVSEAKGECTGYLTGLQNMSAVTSDSTGQMKAGVSKLLAAVQNQLEPGAKKLNDGADELYIGLKDGQEEIAANTKDKDSKVDMMSEPVQANGDLGTGETITEVKNYGTGFAPYFIGLALWVGALMISFLVKSLNTRILMSRASSIAAVIASYLPMLIISIVQAVILLLFIQFGLDMNINYVWQYYLFGVLVSFCFTAIVQFFRASLGTVGMVVIVVLLMLQLCTAAGTFPIEAEIPFFNVLNPYLPMTYVVQGFRMAMCGLSPSYMVNSVIILAIFTIAFLFLTTLVAHHKRRVTMSTLYPPIKLAG